MNPVTLFIALTLLLLVLLLQGLARSLEGIRHRNVLGTLIMSMLALILWTGALAVLASRHFFENWIAAPPRLPLTLLPPMLVLLWVALRPLPRTMAEKLPASWLTGLQGLRLAPAWVFVILVQEAALPRSLGLAMAAGNALFGMGSLALLLWQLRRRRNVAARIWHGAGILMTLGLWAWALLSAPGLYQLFEAEPGAAILGTFPYVWWLGFISPFWVLLHVLAIRQGNADDAGG